jgi:hypothetical protein
MKGLKYVGRSYDEIIEISGVRTLLQVMHKTMGEGKAVNTVQLYDLSFLTSALDGGEWSAKDEAPAVLYPVKNPRYQF